MNLTTSILGRVIEGYGGRLLVEDDSGESYQCVPQTKRQLVVCGDQVEILPKPQGDSVINRILPRNSVLEREDSRGKKKPIAANFDRLLIVSAAKPGIQVLNIDRYLVLAELLRIKPILLFHKADLSTQDAATTSAELDPLELAKIYTHIGYQTHMTSTKIEKGLETLSIALQNHTGVLLGQSGVGKSSIIHKLCDEPEIRIGGLSVGSGLGKHTTTAARLYRLPLGGELIDSPGVREFTIPNLSAEQIRNGYLECVKYATGCRFKDCSHMAEPSCAVKQAVKDGEIAPSRWQTYQSQLKAL